MSHYDENETRTCHHPDCNLTDEQVENWRKTLFGMIGPAALILPREEIQSFRDSMQSRADKMVDESGR